MKAKELAKLLLELPEDQQEMEVGSTEEGYFVASSNPRLDYLKEDDFLSFKETNRPFIYI
jgi:hypothetical protein